MSVLAMRVYMLVFIIWLYTLITRDETPVAVFDAIFSTESNISVVLSYFEHNTIETETKSMIWCRFIDTYV